MKIVKLSDIYRVIAGHSNYHGDSILAALTCLAEGKTVGNVRPIDAVPVVRCRDCKYFMEYTNEHRFASAYDGDCGILAGYTDCEREARKYMDYCSDGERKGKRKHEEKA